MIQLSEDSFLILLVLLLTLAGIMLYKLIARPNSLVWEDLVATNGRLNAYKLGYWLGSLTGLWVVVKQTYLGHLDAGVFAAWLGFLGGVAVMNSAVRARESARRDVDDPDRR